jgi:hypothetical protein
MSVVVRQMDRAARAAADSAKGAPGDSTAGARTGT